MIALFILLVFIANAVWGIYKKQRLSKENLSQTAAVYAGLRSRGENLELEIKKLKTESGQEEEIRERYGLVKPGEEVIVIVGDDIGQKETDSSSDGLNFWQKILNWLK